MFPKLRALGCRLLRPRTEGGEVLLQLQNLACADPASFIGRLGYGENAGPSKVGSLGGDNEPHAKSGPNKGREAVREMRNCIRPLLGAGSPTRPKDRKPPLGCLTDLSRKPFSRQ